MKTKLTKKMLSLFLAVLMVISALPFTAVTAFADNGGSLGAPVAKVYNGFDSAVPKFDGTNVSDSNCYQNILYAENCKTSDGGNNNDNKDASVVFDEAGNTLVRVHHNKLVAVYDGKKDIIIPVMAGVRKTKNENRYIFTVYPTVDNASSTYNTTRPADHPFFKSRYLTDNDDNYSFKGKEGRNNLKFNDARNDGSKIGSARNNNGHYSDNCGYSMWRYYWGFYATAFKITKDINFNSATGMDFKPYWAWYGGSATNNNTDGKASDPEYVNANMKGYKQASHSIYIIDYTKHLSHITTVENEIAGLNASHYTKASVQDYYNAAQALYDVNLQTAISGASTAQDAYNKAVSAIDNAYTSYTEAKSKLVKTTDAGIHNTDIIVSSTAATCTSESTENCKCSICGYETVTHNTPAKGHNFDGVEWKSYGDTGSHYKYCKNDSCDKQGAYYQSENHDIVTVRDGDNLVVKCSKCDYVKSTTALDFQNYNTVVTLANEALKDSSLYTDDSVAALNSALTTGAEIIATAVTQKDIDDAATAIQTAIGKLELLVIKYDVVFMYQFQGEEAVEVIKASYDKDEEIELKVPEDALAQGVVYKWYTSTTDGDKPYATSVNSTTLIVNKDITIVAKLQKNTTDVASAVKVNLLDKSGKTIAIAYTSSSSISLNESSITVDGNELEAKQIPFYNVRGFKVDGGAAVSSTTYDIPAGVTEINVMPNYVAEKKIVITVNSDVKLNGKSVSSYEATWNQAITMTAETEVNWYANGKLIAQGTTYKFCANADVIITTDTTTPVTIDPSVEIGYFNYDSSLNKVTVVSNFYAPQGTISDAGVILSTKTSDVETLKKATGGVFKVNSGNFTSNGNQVKISVSRTATTHFTMYALAFIVVDGVTYYADSVSTCVY